MDSEKFLIFLPKAEFQENDVRLFLFSDRFLLLGPVAVFFSYLALLSFSSWLSNPAGVLQSVASGLRYQLAASGTSLSLASGHQHPS